MLPENYNPEYYNLTNPVELTGNNTSLSSAFIGSGVDEFQKALKKEVEKLDPSFRKLTFKVLTRVPGVGNLVAREVEVALDPEKERYTVGEFIIDTAETAAVGAVLTAFAASVGVAGTSVLGVAAIGVGASLIWDGVKEAGDELLDIILGTVQTDIQILDTNNDVIGGAFIQEGVAEENEFAAIKELLGQTIKNDLPFDNKTLPPDIIAGENNIRIVRQNSFTDGEDVTYRVYDGELIDIISSEFDVTEEELLALGTENAPNTNEQISFLPTLLNAPSYIFAADENRFYVPLPDTNGGTEVTGIHPGNIYYGSNSDDMINAFEDDNNRDPDLLSEEALMLGLTGNDTIKGNIGKDIIFGGAGNDNLDGSAGEDTAVFSDDFANYDYSIDDNGVITFTHARGTQADGTDTLINIEQAQFKDQIVSLPLEEPQTEPGSVSELEDGSVTFKFKTTLDESQSSTFIGLPPEIVGTNPEIELTYTFTPTQTRFGFTGLAPVPSTYNRVTGSLRINDQTTALDYGDIKVSDGKNNDGYNVSFIPKNDASLFGYDIGRIALDISDGSYFDNNGDLIQGGTIFNSISIPTNAQFANKDSLFFDLLITANAPRNEVENSIFVSVNERASSSERTPFTLTSDNGGEETSDEIPEESTTEESLEEPIDEENSESEQPPMDEQEIVEPSINEDELEPEDPDSLIGEVPENNSPINNPQETEIQLQIFSPDLESPITEPLISAIRIQDEYTELSTLGSDTSDLVPVDVNIDLDFGTGSVPGRISFEVDENEGSGSFAPGEFNGYVFTDVFDEIPAIENVILSETGNSLGLESSDITFTENTIEVNVESLAYSPGLNALLDVEFADL